MQPSGPVPNAATTASGSGPHADLALPQTAGEALRAWDTVLRELQDRKKFSLAGPLEHARVVAWNADVLELGFPVDVHAMGEMAADASALTFLIARMHRACASLMRMLSRLRDQLRSDITHQDRALAA